MRLQPPAKPPAKSPEKPLEKYANMAPVLIFPTETEAAPLRRLRPDLDVRICGVGMAQCARFAASLLSQPAGARPECVVLCGVAGAYDRRLALRDTLCVTVEREAGVPARFAEEYAATEHFAGLAGVVSNTVSGVGAAADGAAIENMEGAALFALCAAAGVRCGEIRAVSNYTGDPREKWDIDGAAESLARILMKLF